MTSRDYPGSYAELLSGSRVTMQCLDYLDWLRWPDAIPWPLLSRMREASEGVGRAVGVRRLWASGLGDVGDDLSPHPNPADGVVRGGVADDQPEARVSALGLKRALGIGSEQTAWAMLHRYRMAMVRPGRDRLGGIVEADETLIGGPEPGRPGRGAQGKMMVEVAVERAGRALGRCRMQVIEDAGSTLGRSCLPTWSPGRS